MQVNAPVRTGANAAVLGGVYAKQMVARSDYDSAFTGHAPLVLSGFVVAAVLTVLGVAGLLFWLHSRRRGLSRSKPAELQDLQTLSPPTPLYIEADLADHWTSLSIASKACSTASSTPANSTLTVHEFWEELDF
ncbi:MAG: hypothetical protein KVP17_005350 [Porospora cf. gigantea B]|uniref:uncharacterized protein n=1 Tax=Porospora cf. gigantea B TaxID=2853592 RepID=UPI003571CCBE|nr:MAG: hypothetical protein KVP17_005350 [Porospora cf. gigantea B]